MFRRRWVWFGKLVSDEGFCLRFGNRSVIYADERGEFQFGLEDGLLFPASNQISGMPVILDQEETKLILERIVQGIKSEGHFVKIFRCA
jgi:hypothetical protein